MSETPDISIMLTIVDEEHIGFSLGATDYLSKPVDWDRLSATIEKHCGETGGDILVVEDDAGTRELLVRTLQKEGWEVREADGHDYAELTAVLGEPAAGGRPLFVIAHTVKGRGVSFMENVAKWHHGVPGAADYERALSELDAAEAALATSKEVVGS